MPLSIERLLGHLLRSQRGRDRSLAMNDPRMAAAPPSLHLSSTAFSDGGPMPARQAAAGIGDELSPPLAWSGLPEGTRELVLVVQDPDAPLPRAIVHCIATGIDPASGGLAEGVLKPGRTPPGVQLGRGSFGAIGYQGARPILGHGAHRYLFQLFALAGPVGIEKPNLATLLTAMEGRVLATGHLVGTYERD